MKFCLFDDINTFIARKGLYNALNSQGHIVRTTPRFSRSHHLIADNETIDIVDKAIDSIIQDKPDVLINFRPPTLLPRMVKRLRDAGIFTMTWFTDDPVLYNICYRHVIDLYDFVLHAGDERILSFYEQRHAARGVNFPFWADDTQFSYRYDSRGAEYDIAFMGTIVGSVKSNRYDIITSFPYTKRIFGVVKYDYDNLWGGYLSTPHEINSAFSRAKFALNIPQFFSDYLDHNYYFSGLENLGFYQFPSRIPQYAAIGTPIIYYGTSETINTFPELIVGSTTDELVNQLDNLVNNFDLLESISQKTYLRFKKSFSAESRVALIESIIAEPEHFANLPTHKRSTIFSNIYKIDEESVLNSIAHKNRNKRNSNCFFPVLSNFDDEARKIKKQKDLSTINHNVFLVYISDDLLQENYIESTLKSLISLGNKVFCLARSENITYSCNCSKYGSFISRIIGKYTSIIKAIKEIHPDYLLFIDEVDKSIIDQIEFDSEQDVKKIVFLFPGTRKYILENTSRFDALITTSREIYKQNVGTIGNLFLFPISISKKDILFDQKVGHGFFAKMITFESWLDLGKTTEINKTLERFSPIMHSIRSYSDTSLEGNAPYYDDYIKKQILRGGKFHFYRPPAFHSENELIYDILISIASGGIAVIHNNNIDLLNYFTSDSEIINLPSDEELEQRLKDIEEKNIKYISIKRRAILKVLNFHIAEKNWQLIFEGIKKPLENQPFFATTIGNQISIINQKIKMNILNVRFASYTRNNLNLDNLLSDKIQSINEPMPVNSVRGLVYGLFGERVIRFIPKKVKDVLYKLFEFSKKIAKSLPVSISQKIKKIYLQLINKFSQE